MSSRRDLNSVEERDLLDAGLEATDAQALLLSRPFYSLEDIAWLPEPVRSRLAERFFVPRLTYCDKQSGKRVELSPSTDRVVLKHGEPDLESVPGSLTRSGYAPLAPKGAAAAHQAFCAPESEGAVAWARLKQRYRGKIAPSVRDQRRGLRFVDTKFVNVVFARGTAKERRESIVQGIGGLVARSSRDGLAYALRLPLESRHPGGVGAAVEALNAAAEVRFAEPSYLGLDDLEADPRGVDVEAANLAWNLRLVNASEALRLGAGSPEVLVALLDSGVDPSHPALAGALLSRPADESWSFVEGDAPDPKDELGHGTFIAGLLAGNGKDGVRGLCPGCKILPLKVPLSGGRHDYLGRRDAIVLATAKANAGTRVVMNLSWKTSGDVALIRDAVRDAVEHGVVVVTSAGNWPERENEPHYPSDYREVISVAAVGPDRRRAVYSYFGDEVDIAAPGGSDDASGKLTSANLGGGTRSDAGTSYAAPHVAAVAALLLSARSDASVLDVRQALDAGAVAAADRGLGAGILDAASALARFAAGTGVAPEPSKAPLAPPSAPRPTRPILELLNEGSLADLVRDIGVLPITARLIAAKRPIPNVNVLEGTLGLTAAQYETIAALALRAPAAAPLDIESAGAKQGNLDVDPGIYHEVLRHLTWNERQPFVDSYDVAYQETQRQRFARMLAGFSKAGIGAKLELLWSDLPVDARERVLASPMVRNVLLDDPATDYLLIRNSLIAEHARLGQGIVPEGGVWTALGDAYFPGGPARLEAPRPFDAPPCADQIFVAPTLESNTVVDYYSVHAIRPLDGILVKHDAFDWPEVTGTLEGLRTALAWVRAIDAGAFDLIRQFLRTLVMRKNASSTDTWSASSVEYYIGRMVLVNPQIRQKKLASTAEGLVHESIHSVIYVVEERYPLLSDRGPRCAAARAESAWSGRSLSIHAAVHATLVWFGLWCFWRKARGKGVLEEDALEKRIEYIRRGFRSDVLPRTFEIYAPFMAANAKDALGTMIAAMREGAYGD